MMIISKKSFSNFLVKSISLYSGLGTVTLSGILFSMPAGAVSLGTISEAPSFACSGITLTELVNNCITPPERLAFTSAGNTFLNRFFVNDNTRLNTVTFTALDGGDTLTIARIISDPFGLSFPLPDSIVFSFRSLEGDDFGPAETGELLFTTPSITTDTFSVNSPADVPEPFTIVGTLIGGTAAFRMRKKLKKIAD